MDVPVVHRLSDSHLLVALCPYRSHCVLALTNKNISNKYTADGITYLGWFNLANLDFLGKLPHSLGSRQYCE